MTERPIEELLGHLPAATDPDPSYEARLRQRLVDELRAPQEQAGPPAAGAATTTDVLELEGTTTAAVRSPRASSWLRAAAAAAVVAVVIGMTALNLRHDDVSPTVTTPDATFVGATMQTTAIDMTANDPYFVAALDDAWVMTLGGDLIRVGDTGAAARMAIVPESSPLAVDENAVWIADAVDGRVLRLDPADGSLVAEIETGIEVRTATTRIPMVEGPSRQFALIGGIVADGASVWVGDRSGRVLRIDPETNEIVDSFDVPVRPDQLQLDGDHLLVVNLTGHEAAVVDSTTGDVVTTSKDIDDLAGAAIRDGALFLQDAADGTVIRVDLGTGEQRASRPLGASPVHIGTPVLQTAPLATAAGLLVHADTAPENLHVLDLVTLEETGTLAVPKDYGDMTVAGDGSVWLVRGNTHQVVHIVPRPR